MGNSRQVLRDFPKAAKKELGDALDALQLGFKPKHYRSFSTIGFGVEEIKHQDNRAWYRVFYLLKMKGRIYVLHAFEKESGKTSKKDLRTAKLRYKEAMKYIRRGASG